MKNIVLATLVFSVLSATTIVSYAADKMGLAMPTKVSARSTILYSPTSLFK